MSVNDETQRLHADPKATQMPGPLDLAGTPSADTTDVLSLDELFGDDPDQQPQSPAPAPAPAAAPAGAAGADAPTWTAMPVVPVRSEPVATERRGDAQPEPGPSVPAQPGVAERVLADASAAWRATTRRGNAWLRAGDNALMLLTALVAIVLIVVVAALGG